MNPRWRVEGYDTFAREAYLIGEFNTAAEAEAVAQRHQAQLAQQPEALRDRVWVVPPLQQET